MSRNVIVLILDCVRKDRFDAHASRLQSLSDVSFTRAYAPSTWSVPSHASLITGELPHQHGVHSHNLNFDTIPLENTFLDSLDMYSTYCVSANGYANGEFGFDQFFDGFSHIDSSGLPQFTSVKFPDIGGIELLSSRISVESWLEGLPIPYPRDNGTKAALSRATEVVERQTGPSFLFVNLMDAHAPHRATRGYDNRKHDVSPRWSSNDVSRYDIVANIHDHQSYLENYRALYDASIRYLDERVSSFVESALEASPNTTVILTADHGENLGLETEGSEFGHTSSVSEGLTHVPFEIINPPTGRSGSDSALFSIRNLGELISTYAEGREYEPSGGPVVGEVIGRAIKMNENPSYWDRMIRYCVDGNRKYVWDSLDRTFEYAIRPNAPTEETLVNDAATVPAETLEAFDADLISYKRNAVIEDATTTDRMSDVAEQRLEGLGYLG